MPCDFVIYHPDDESGSYTPMPGDLLFYDTALYSPKQTGAMLAYLQSLAINRLTRYLQWSTVTHISMILDVSKDEQGNIINCVIADSMPFKTPYIDVLGPNHDKGWQGYIFRYTGEQAETVRQLAATIAYSHTLDKANKEQHSVFQAIRSTLQGFEFEFFTRASAGDPSWRL